MGTLKRTGHRLTSWFTEMVLNNQVVVALMISLLILLNLLILSRLPGLWTPIRSLFDILGIPIIIAGVGYYLINPLVDRLQRRFHVNRLVTITGIFLIIIGLIVWGLFTIVPIIQEQFLSLLRNWPRYWDHLEAFVLQAFPGATFKEFRGQITNLNQDLAAVLSGGKQSQFMKLSLNSLASFVSHLSTILIALITAPFILFYLLKDGQRVPSYLAHFVPYRMRESFLRILTDMNRQVSNYVRGQLTVAFFVAVMFSVGYGIIGLKFALLLGITSGILNLIPYLGSFLAMVPSIVVGAFISPVMLIKVLIVFVIEQTLEGRVISPLVLGNTLSIHPVTIIFILLASGKLFGIVGVILGIPGYAVLKVILTELFHWYRQHSDFEKQSE
ncbi:permease [Secundilactobacillus similis DSM 23365 = JCM 2765]|uniref:Permease n=1 Tax=Secundilactobacillus similis DSM 23365 = JCM 2765 TaxID=1423804 RepID=A0A0R2FCQ2_9LACO|nr:AI-2E family transporter [Secundilactobacillus similis]KRN26200.1 permease [Secundilactobacillus similis DSM 23365 = JCM 2765]